MSDTEPRNPTAAPQRLADAVLRACAGTTALLRICASNTGSTPSEMGLSAANFAEVTVSPAAMRKFRPLWKEGDESKWELLISATGVEQQVNTLSLDSAQTLFAMTTAVTVAGQDYLIEAVSSNEAFGTIYLYRLLLREARKPGV